MQRPQTTLLRQRQVCALLIPSALSTALSTPSSSGCSHQLLTNLSLPVTGPVIINELLALPGTTGSTPEFVELLNVGAAAVALQGWQLSTGNGSSSSWAFPASTVVGPGAYLVVHTSVGKQH